MSTVAVGKGKLLISVVQGHPYLSLQNLPAVVNDLRNSCKRTSEFHSPPPFEHKAVFQPEMALNSFPIGILPDTGHYDPRTNRSQAGTDSDKATRNEKRQAYAESRWCE